MPGTRRRQTRKNRASTRTTTTVVKKTSRRGNFRRAMAPQRMVSSNQNVHKVIARYSLDAAPSQGLTVNNYMYAVLSGPYSVYSGATYLYNTKEWAIYSKLFDRWRLAGVKARFVPLGNMVDFQWGAVNQGDGVIAPSTHRLHSVVDQDGPAPDDISILRTYASYRSSKMYKTLTRKLGYKYAKNQWFDTSAPPTETNESKESSFSKAITVYGENFPESNGTVINVPMYRLEIEYYLVFQGLSIGSISKTTEGHIVLKDIADNIANAKSSTLPEAEDFPLYECPL